MTRRLPLMFFVPICLVLWTALSAAPVRDVEPAPEAVPPGDVAVTTPAPETTDPVEPVVEPAATALPLTAPPFVGVVSATAVNVRGGPSANHYPVARLKKGAEVQVLQETFGWYQVTPPEGVFCWVFKDYVTVAADGKAGAVTGNNVNVRGDSILGHTPMKSDVVDQVGAGTTVTVIGSDGDFLRIAPTAGAKVYVHRDFILPKSGAPAAPAPAADKPASPKTVNLAAGALREAEKALKAEPLKKPIEWDLDKLRGLYQAILAKDPSAREKAIAESRLQYIDRLAKLKATLDAVERGRKETEEALKAIEDRRAAEEAALAAKSAAPAYTQIGLLQTLELTDGKPRFKLVDPDNPTTMVCVVEGDPSVLRRLVGRRVGINGRFRVSAEWSVRKLEVTSVQALATGDDTRIAKPPAPTN